MKIPSFDSMMNPLLKTLHERGGSGTISEIDGKGIAKINGIMSFHVYFHQGRFFFIEFKLYFFML
jgi:hypothetical protein